jgi:6-phosphogluconolactonase
MKSLSRERPVDSELLYVGTYTEPGRREGIHRVAFDARTGALRVIDAIEAGVNPSFLALHPSRRALYSVNEVGEHAGTPTGALRAFAINRETGALIPIGSQSSGGRGPCYVSIDRSGRAALIANYDSGSVALLPIDRTGAISAPTTIDQHSGRGPNVERQEGPHAHCIVPHPTNRFAIAADLGTDRVLVYDLDAATGVLRHRESGDLSLQPGAGPRHIAFHPTLPLLFVANELNSTVAALHFDQQRGALSLISTRPTTPHAWRGENYPADIHVAPSGNVVYVSNRGHDSIAAFSIETTSGALDLAQTTSTEGSWPRNFSLAPNGRWLLVANQKSNAIVVLARDRESGRLTSTGQRLEISSPTCIRFASTSV